MSVIKITPVGVTRYIVVKSGAPNGPVMRLSNTVSSVKIVVKGLIPQSGGSGGGGDNTYGELLSSGTNTFITENNFKTNTTRLYLNGQKLSLGSLNDYVEIGNTAVTYNFTLTGTDKIEIDYEKQ